MKSSLSALRNLLVFGGHGVTGGAIVDVGKAEAGWSITTAGRRPSDADANDANGQHHVSVDLLDEKQSFDALSRLSGITDVAFAAFTPASPKHGETDLNIGMLANALRGLGSLKGGLKRVVLIGGGKSYGPHLGHYRTPARESDPRVMGPIFYDAQQDLLTEWSARNGTSWTILRPDLMFGPSLKSPMNMVTSLAAFALISRELGIKLRFPGSYAAWSALFQATDASLLGRAAFWALGADGAKGEIFNVINGDQFRWRHIWAGLASFFEMEVDEPQPMSLAAQMEDKEPVWQAVVVKYGLRPVKLADMASWPFLDMLLNVEFDMVQSTIKIRKAGFADCVDTHESLINQLGNLRKLRLVP
jgi:nucleoside-diphosphate-sugar epimerase